METVLQDRQHGIRTTYEAHGCRCDPCKLWRRNYRISCLSKPCSNCKEAPRTTSGFCNPCSALKARERRRNHPEKFRGIALKSRYGITVDEYNVMVLAQDGVCAICGDTNPSGRQLAVDHDHATGKVRALLCSRCNTALGQMRDNPELMRKAAAYIEEHKNG